MNIYTICTSAQGWVFCLHMFVSSEDPDPSLLHSGDDLVLHYPIGLARHCHNPNLHTTPGSGEIQRYVFMYHLHWVFVFISMVSSHVSSTAMFVKTKEDLQCVAGNCLNYLIRLFLIMACYKDHIMLYFHNFFLFIFKSFLLLFINIILQASQC